MEEGQEKFHVQLHSLLIIKNGKIEELWKFYQGFVNTEPTTFMNACLRVLIGYEYSYHCHNPSQQNKQPFCLSDLLSFIYRLFFAPNFLYFHTGFHLNSIFVPCWWLIQAVSFQNKGKLPEPKFAPSHDLKAVPSYPALLFHCTPTLES